MRAGRETVAPGQAAETGRRLFVKICGVTGEEAARAAAEAGADAVGFVFYRGSRRYVDREVAARLGRLLPEGMWRVGVFVDAPLDEVAETVAKAGLTAVQLHGDEGPETAEALRRRCGVAVIKALSLRSPADLGRGRAWAGSPPDFFLLDAAPAPAGAASAAPGGTGRTFDWRWAADAAAVLPAPFLLAGGLTPGNVAAALAAVRPAGVDVSSGVERDGRKDPALIRAFVEAVQAWEGAERRWDHGEEGDGREGRAGRAAGASG